MDMKKGPLAGPMNLSEESELSSSRFSASHHGGTDATYDQHRTRPAAGAQHERNPNQSSPPPVEIIGLVYHDFSDSSTGRVQRFATDFHRFRIDQHKRDAARLATGVDPVVNRAALDEHVTRFQVHEIAFLQLHVDFA